MLAVVIGGSGSGKSEYAERMALHLAGQRPRFYLATMQVWDEECQARVKRHRKQRAGRGFVTVERPKQLAGIPREQLDREGTVLLEDLGNLVANELYAPGADEEKAEQAIWQGVEHLVAKPSRGSCFQRSEHRRCRLCRGNRKVSAIVGAAASTFGTAGRCGLRSGRRFANLL